MTSPENARRCTARALLAVHRERTKRDGEAFRRGSIKGFSTSVGRAAIGRFSN